MIVDKVFVINLKSRTDRKQNMIIELNKAQIENYEFFDAVEPVSETEINNWNPNFVKNKPPWLNTNFLKYRLGSLGCMLSHIEIMKIALQRKYEKILILEDDIQFKFLNGQSFESIFKNFIEKELMNIPYDFLYLGGIHSLDKLTQVTKHIHKTTATGTTSSYILNKRAMNLILTHITSTVNEIDIFYKKLQNLDVLNIYTIIPCMVIQKPDYSNIIQKNVAYIFDNINEKNKKKEIISNNTKDILNNINNKNKRKKRKKKERKNKLK